MESGSVLLADLLTVEPDSRPSWEDRLGLGRGLMRPPPGQEMAIPPVPDYDSLSRPPRNGFTETYVARHATAAFKVRGTS